MSSPWRRFSLQVNSMGFGRKKSEPGDLISHGTLPHGRHQLSRYGHRRRTRDTSPNVGVFLNCNAENSLGPSSNPESPKCARLRVAGKQRDSSPASSGGVAPSKPTTMIPGGGGDWYNDSAAAGDGIDEIDGAGSGGAHDSRSSGGGSADWTATFPDGSSWLDVERLRLMTKMDHIKEKLVAANKTKEADVDEFLRLTANSSMPGDNPQMIRIRQVFEKKNKKSTHTILTLQKKLDSYQQKLRELEAGNVSSGGVGIVRKPKSENVLTNVGQGLKDVGANIKESLTGYTGGMFENIKEGLSGLSSASQSAAGTVISVPKDLAHKFLKKSDSADNLHNHGQGPQSPPLLTSTAGAASLATTSGGSGRSSQDNSTTTKHDGDSQVADAGNSRHTGSLTRNAYGTPSAVFYTDLDKEKITSDATSASDVVSGRALRSASPPAIHPSASSRTMVQQNAHDTPVRRGGSSHGIDSHRYEHQQAQFEHLLQELQSVKRSNEQLVESVHEVRSKIQHDYSHLHAAVHELTFRIQRVENQLNDQAELHSAEVNGLRADLQTVEARVSYQMTQVDGDLKDIVGRAITRVEALEHRVKDQFGVDQNALGTLAIRAGYLLAQTFLTIVFLLTQGLLPFMKTRARSVTTVVIVFVAIILYRNLHFLEDLTQRSSGKG